MVGGKTTSPFSSLRSSSLTFLELLSTRLEYSPIVFRISIQSAVLSTVLTPKVSFRSLGTHSNI